GFVGLGALLVSAFALVLTTDRTLNSIWRVRRPRPLARRPMLYWAVMTLGPPLLAASLTLTSYAVSVTRGWVSGMPGAVQWLLDLTEFFLLVAGLAALYRYVPNPPVRPAHALAGGLFAAVAMELAMRLLAWYISVVPTYSA